MIIRWPRAFGTPMNTSTNGSNILTRIIPTSTTALNISRTLVSITGCLCLLGSAQAQSLTLRLGPTKPLPGVQGRIYHMAADVPGQHLFIAALGNKHGDVG